MPEKRIEFKLIEWKDWVKDIYHRFSLELSSQYKVESIVEDMLEAPPLDPENILPFCTHFMFDCMYENKVFVSHKEDPDSYWFINSDDTCLLHKPQTLIKTELES